MTKISLHFLHLESEPSNSSRGRSVKNTDIDYHRGNQAWNYMACKLCEKKPKPHLTVNHYAKCHADFENFASRLTPEGAAKFRTGEFDLEYLPGKIKMYCVFHCDVHEKQRKEWLENCIYINTGDYGHDCPTHEKKAKIGSCAKKNCYVDSSKYEQQMAQDVCLTICNLCNWVHPDENNVINHIRTQHDDNHVDGKYLTVTYIPKPKNQMRRRRSTRAQSTHSRQMTISEGDFSCEHISSQMCLYNIYFCPHSRIHGQRRFDV